MIKTEYFCDRCQKNVTAVGAQFALNKVCVEISGRNPRMSHVCRDCAEAVLTFAESMPVGAVGRRSE